jgi:hypothetical protein
MHATQGNAPHVFPGHGFMRPIARKGCFIPWAARPKSGALCAAQSAPYSDIHFAHDPYTLSQAAL